jgi:hypothetical protein
MSVIFESYYKWMTWTSNQETIKKK